MKDEKGAIGLPDMMEIWQQTLNWRPNPKQQQQFQHFYELILEGNRQLNLTRIIEPEEFWEKHLWDSLSGVKRWLGEQAKNVQPLSVIDIGTGAGFPGVPVAIACPQWHITLLDSTRKKMAFLENTLAALEIHNAKALTDRVEQVGHHPQYRAGFDLALIRAVATASVCAEYALPLLKLGGQAVLYRGQWTDEDTLALEPALNQLGGTLEAIEPLTTPVSQGIRHCIHLKKTKPTPTQFPRSVGVPVQKPL